MTQDFIIIFENESLSIQWQLQHQQLIWEEKKIMGATCNLWMQWHCNKREFSKEKDISLICSHS